MILPGITDPMAMDVDAADDAGVDNDNGNGSENNPAMTTLVLITITEWFGKQPRQQRWRQRRRTGVKARKSGERFRTRYSTISRRTEHY